MPVSAFPLRQLSDYMNNSQQHNRGPGDRNFLIHKMTEAERKAGLTYADIIAGVKPEDVTKPIAANDTDHSRGGGLFVAVKVTPTMRTKVVPVRRGDLEKFKRTPKRICIHHIGGDSRCSLTEARIARIVKEHDCAGLKCRHHVDGWQAKALQCGAYLPDLPSE